MKYRIREDEDGAYWIQEKVWGLFWWERTVKYLHLYEAREKLKSLKKGSTYWDENGKIEK